MRNPLPRISYSAADPVVPCSPERDLMTWFWSIRSGLGSWNSSEVPVGEFDIARKDEVGDETDMPPLNTHGVYTS